MGITKALKRQLAALEAAIPPHASVGALPVVVEASELESAAANDPAAAGLPGNDSRTARGVMA
jgi:hypothetical protein